MTHSMNLDDHHRLSTYYFVNNEQDALSPSRCPLSVSINPGDGRMYSLTHCHHHHHSFIQSLIMVGNGSGILMLCCVFWTESVAEIVMICRVSDSFGRD